MSSGKKGAQNVKKLEAAAALSSNGMQQIEWPPPRRSSEKSASQHQWRRVLIFISMPMFIRRN